MAGKKGKSKGKRSSKPPAPANNISSNNSGPVPHIEGGLPPGGASPKGLQQAGKSSRANAPSRNYSVNDSDDVGNDFLSLAARPPPLVGSGVLHAAGDGSSSSFARRAPLGDSSHSASPLLSGSGGINPAGINGINAGGLEFRHTNGSSGWRDVDWRRRALGERERERERDTMGERDREKDNSSGRGVSTEDDYHNGEPLRRSPYIRHSAQREWSWLGYSSKQFRSFVQEFPPTLDVGADEVRAKIEDIKCGTCRDRLHKALDKGLARGGFPLTKLVKLAACRAGEGDNKNNNNDDHSTSSNSGKRVGEPTSSRRPPSSSSESGPVVLSNGGRAAADDSNKKNGGGGGATVAAAAGISGSRTNNGSGSCSLDGAASGDRLRIRAPVTPDLLRQVISVLQTAAATAAVASSTTTSDANAKTGRPLPAMTAVGGRVGDLSAKQWLSTYPAPASALLEGGTSNGFRGTGTGSLAIPLRGRSQLGASENERNPWVLMERAERAKDNAFKCCGVIEASTGVGLHDPSAASSNGGGVGAGGAGNGGGSSSSTMATNMEWNPQFAPRLQEAEAAIMDWLTELTMALHGLTFQFSLAFVNDEGASGGGSGGSDLAETTALAEDLWTAYEDSVKRQLELTLEARREQLREQSQQMGIALCFAPQNRACAAELLERKRAEMTALHEATIGVMGAPKIQPLLSRAEKARQKWSGLLVAEDLHSLDELVERVLKARLQVFKSESFAYNSSVDVIQAEQMADAQLKAVVQEWETMMDNFKLLVEERVSKELNYIVYPQSPTLTSALSSWLSTFQTDWVSNETTQQLHAHIRQRQVHGLGQDLVVKKQRLKTLNEELNELGKQLRKKDNRSPSSNGNGNGSGAFSASSEQSEDLAKKRELEERCQSQATAVSLTQQGQIETCLTYRLFAVGQLHQRYRRLRLFFAQLGCRVAARASQATHLCGGDSEAQERVKMLGICLNLGIVEEACLRWTAVQNERQLVEGMDREDASQDAKRRKRERAKAKVRETKTAAVAATAVAAAAAAAAAEEAEVAKATKAASTRAAKAPKKKTTAKAAPAQQSSAVVGISPTATVDVPINSKISGALSGETGSVDSKQDNSKVGPDNGDGTRDSLPGKSWVKNGDERSSSTTRSGWHGAERTAPMEDEDGFVTIAKSKPRRSAVSRDTASLNQNGRGGWGQVGSGAGMESGRGRGGGGITSGHGLERRDHAPREDKQEKNGQSAVDTGGESVAVVVVEVPPMSTALAGRTWVQRDKPVSEEQPEVCVAAAAASIAAPSPSGVSNGWPVVSAEAPGRDAVAVIERSCNGDGEWRGGGLQGSNRRSATEVTPAVNGVRAPAGPSKPDGWKGVGGDSKTSSLAVPPTPAPPTTRVAVVEEPLVAPEEELPEAAPAPSDTAEEAAAGGLVNNAGKYSGGEKVRGVAEARQTGAGGAAATASGQLGPECEVAQVTRGGLNKKLEIQEETLLTPNGSNSSGGEIQEEEGEEEEEYLFQFGTVNLSDDNPADDAGLQGVEARDSPENRRYNGNAEDELDEGAATGVGVQTGPNGGVAPAPQQVSTEMHFDEKGFAKGNSEPSFAAAESGEIDSMSQPPQAQQLRGGVFFPAHPPTPPQQQQEDHMTPPIYPHHNQGAPMHQHHQQQHQVPTQHLSQGLLQQQLPQQQQQQQRGFTLGGEGLHGMSQHQHTHSIPYQQGMGMGSHLPPSPAGGGGGMQVSGGGGQGLSHHRRVPSHLKGGRHGSNGGRGDGRGGGGPISPNRGPLMPMGGQYGGGGQPLQGMMQQSAATGYWGGGMMHYQVPGQPMMGPAPGGIGVTDGQAVYYPPPPHMMMQGDGSMHGHGGAPWHPSSGHMGMGPGVGMVLDMNGMPAAMPWMPDGGQTWGMHPPQHGWASPTTHGVGFAQQQPQPPPPPRQLHPAVHPANAEQGHVRQGSNNSFKGATTPIHQAESGTEQPLEHDKEVQVQPPPSPLNESAAGHEENPSREQVNGPKEEEQQQPDSTVVGKNLSQTPAGAEAQGLEDLIPELSFSSPPVETSVAPSQSSGHGTRPSQAEAGAIAEPRAEVSEERSVVREGTGVAEKMSNGGLDKGEVVVNGVADASAPGKSQLLEAPSKGNGAAVSASSSATSTAVTRPKKAKKDRGRKGQQTQQQRQQGTGSRQNNGGGGGKLDSPEGLKVKTKGSKGGSRPPPAVTPGATKKDSPSPSAPMPRGLVNAMGQNNCFLNVVVQSLWHLEAFRVRFGSSGNAPSGAWGKKPQACNGGGVDSAAEEPSHRVEASLRGLFRELSEGVEGSAGGDDGSNSSSGGGGTGTTSASVEALRTALAELSGARFGVGKMDDAAEAMETILGCLVQGSSASVIRQVFSMCIREALVCPKCGMSSPEKPATYEANVFYAHVSALREAREKTPTCPFDVALREASHGDVVTCRNGACSLSRRRERLPSQRSITGEPPCVFSLGLVWNNWGPGLVADLLGMLSPVVDLDVVFSRGPKHGLSGAGGGAGEISVGKARLRGFFCFQVQKHHYVAFVYNRGRQEWLLLDDDQAVPIGPDFAGVLARCKQDKLHPSLFFFERQHPLA